MVNSIKDMIIKDNSYTHMRIVQYLLIMTFKSEVKQE